MSAALKTKQVSFHIEDLKDYCQVTAPEKITEFGIDELENHLSSLFLKPFKAYLFDFSAVKEIEMPGLRALSTLVQMIRKSNQEVAVHDLPVNIDRLIVDQGLKKLLHIQKSKKDALSFYSISVKEPPFDFKFIKPFIDGTEALFKKQLGIDLICEKPYVKNPPLGNDIDIVGIINMASGKTQGAIALCFSKDVILKLYETMVGDKHEEINEEVESGASEMLNIIYGVAKTKLKENGFTMDMAIPTIMVGNNLRVNFKAKEKAVVLPFQSSHGSFRLEVLIKN